MSYHIYCLNYGDNHTDTITASFAAVGLSDKVTYCKGFAIDEIKENKNVPQLDPYLYIFWSQFLGQLEMMKEFMTSNFTYGIFCENDIRMHKNIKQLLPFYLDKMNDLDLDILSVGYLLPDKKIFNKDTQILFNLFEYHDEFVGAQMYILTRRKCEEYLQKYHMEYLIQCANMDKIFYYSCVDYNFTKQGKRSAVYPMLALEYISDNWKSSHGGDDITTYHCNCCKSNLNDDYL